MNWVAREFRSYHQPFLWSSLPKFPSRKDARKRNLLVILPPAASHENNQEKNLTITAFLVKVSFYSGDQREVVVLVIISTLKTIRSR